MARRPTRPQTIGNGIIDRARQVIATANTVHPTFAHPFGVPPPIVDGTHFTAPPPTPAEEDALSRQRSLNLHLPSRGVAIIGCGGVGSWIALFLALAGVKNLWLFDFDKITESNLNRFPLPTSAVGQSKADALATALTTLRPHCKPVAMGRFSSDAANILRLSKEVNWLVASTDTWASRREASEWSSKHGIQYLEAAAEGEYGSVTGAPADFATPDESNPGYASVPVWVGPCVIAAMMASAYVLHDTFASSSDVIRIGWNGATIDYFNSSPSTKPAPKEADDNDDDDEEYAGDADVEVA